MPQFFGIRLSEIETQSQHSTRRSCTFKISPQNFLDENHGNSQIESLKRGPSTSLVRRFSRLPPSRRVVNKTVALQGLNQHTAHTNVAVPGHRDQALAQRCRAGLGPKLAARLAHGPTHSTTSTAGTCHDTEDLPRSATGHIRIMKCDVI